MPSLPRVDEGVDFAQVVSKARQLCQDGAELPGHDPGERVMAVITPGRMVVLQSAGPVTLKPDPTTVAAIKTVVPDDPPLNITVIAFPSSPFLGMLKGLAWLGHNVILFEGHPAALRAGCQDADLLIVDEEVADLLQPDWVQAATSVMRTRRIILYLRTGQFAHLNPETQIWLERQTPQMQPEQPKKKPWWWPF